jgi:predicted porin
MRYDPNTGKTEANGARPLFQGTSVVGLTGGFGTVRLGRALTALQATIPAFDPYGADRARGAFVPDIDLAGYNSAPLEAAGGSQNRFANGVFYTTPSLSGFQANLSVQTKQAQDLGTPVSTPFSVSGTYANGPIGALVAYEKNAVRDSIWAVAGSYKLGTANLMATYSKLSAGDVVTGAPVAVDSKAWSLGANVDVGTGNVLAAYGEKKLDSGANSGAKTKKASLGYEHRLSKRTFLYTDLIYRKDPAVSNNDAVKTFDVGVHHNF